MRCGRHFDAAAVEVAAVVRIHRLAGSLGGLEGDLRLPVGGNFAELNRPGGGERALEVFPVQRGRDVRDQNGLLPTFSFLCDQLRGNLKKQEDVQFFASTIQTNTAGTA